MATSNGKKAPAVQSTRQQLDELDALLQRMLALPVNATDSASATEADEAEEPAPIPTPTPAPVVRTPTESSPVLPRRVSLRPGPSVETPVPTPPPAETPTPLSPRLVQPEQAVPVREVTPTSEEDGGEWVPLRGSWQPSAQTWGPLAEAFKQQQQGQTAEAEHPASAEAGVIRETVTIPAPTTPPVPAVEQTTPPPEEPEPGGEVLDSSVEAMARLEAARRAAAPPTRPASPPPLPELPASAPELPPPEATPVSLGTRVALFPLVAVNAVFDVSTYPLGPLGRWMRGSGRTVLAFLGGICLVACSALLAIDWFDWTL